MSGLQKIASFSFLKKIIKENNKIDSDPMRLFVLLLYETSICSGPISRLISRLVHLPLTLDSTTWSRTTLPTAIVVSLLVLLKEKYPCNIMHMWRCMLENAWGVNSSIDCIYRQGRTYF